MNVKGPLDDDFYGEWIEALVQTDAESEILDVNCFANYNNEIGFKVSIDGLHNNPSKVPYGVIHTLNPPGDFYNPSKAENSHVSVSSLIPID
jgi:hypothetical protein